jgi:thioredoxin-like negative regulator of GroEL
MRIKSVEAFEEALAEHPALLVYFSSPTCNVCHALKPKVFAAAAQRYEKMVCLEVDISLTPEVGAKLNVLAAPTVVIFLDGREFVRKSRAFSVDGLLDEIERPYGIFFG